MVKRRKRQTKADNKPLPTVTSRRPVANGWVRRADGGGKQERIITVSFGGVQTGRVTAAQHKAHQAAVRAMVKREDKQLLAMHKLLDQAAGLFLPVELTESRAMVRFHLKLLELRDNFIFKDRRIPKWPGSLKYQRLLMDSFLQLSGRM